MKKRLLAVFWVVVGAMGVGSVLLGMLAPPTRVTAFMAGVGVFILALLREMTWEDRYEDLRERLKDAFTPRDAILQSELHDWSHPPYACLSFEYPLLVCPKRPFRRILARHEALIRKHLPGLPFALRKRSGGGDPFDALDAVVAVLDESAETSASGVTVTTTHDAQHSFREFLSIARGMSRPPPAGCMHVVVKDEDAVSLRMLVARPSESGQARRELALASEDVIFEPRRQTLVRFGDVLVQGWRPTASSRSRERRVAVPAPARSREEYLTRVVAASDALLRAHVDRHLELGGSRRLLLSVRPSPELGVQVAIVAVDRDGWHKTLQRCPGSERVVASAWPDGWLPVFVSQAAFGGIRWLAYGPEADPERRPLEVTEWHQPAARFPRRVYGGSG